MLGAPALLVNAADVAPLRRGFQPWIFAHAFTFTATPFPQNAVGFLSFTFKPGSEFLWTAVNVVGSNPTAANTDPAAEFFVSFFVGYDRRPLQNEPIKGSTIRGGGFDAAARRSFGLPFPVKPVFFQPNEPIRVDVDNRRAPAIGQVVTVDVELHGMRRYRGA